jgi:integrase
VPKDAPPEQLRKLLDAVQTAATSSHAGLRRCGRLDHAWVLLMLHSGLRTGEVRRLRLDDIDWERKRVRIEQSKGLKDRLVPLSEPTIAALKAYLEVRGPAEALPPELFIYRHAPLSLSYCGKRLAQYYAGKTGITLTPHQLRHSCATLLLNAGAPILTVRAILGHFHIDTTLAYARLYDGTVAADYYRAMLEVERTLVLPEKPAVSGLSDAELVALVDSLRSGTLNDYQAETVRVLRSELVSRARREAGAPAEGEGSQGQTMGM